MVIVVFFYSCVCGWAYRGLHSQHGGNSLVVSVWPDDCLHRSLHLFLKETVKEVSTEEFDRHKTALAVRRQEKPKQLSHRAVRYWSEITTGQYFFDRNVEIEKLMQITHQELLDFFSTFVFHHSPQRRKIAVHIVATNVLFSYLFVMFLICKYIHLLK